jgi:hypothetical protein
MTDHAALRDQLAAALHALDVQSVADPDLDAYDASLVLAGAVAFRLADLSCPAVEAEHMNSHDIRARFAQGWNDLRDAAGCDATSEAAVLSVFTDLIGTAARANAAKEQNPYAKAASFAMEAAAALLYLSTDYDATNPAEVSTRAGANLIADDRLTHAHAWLAHLGSTS